MEVASIAGLLVNPTPRHLKPLCQLLRRQEVKGLDCRPLFLPSDGLGLSQLITICAKAVQRPLYLILKTALRADCGLR